MKQLVLTILSAILATTGVLAQGTMTFTTSAPKGTEVRILANVVSATQPLTIDFGNGVAQKFTIDPDQAAWQRWINGTIEGSTITVSGQVTEFQLQEAQLTSAAINGMSNLTKLDLSKNSLTSFELLSMIPLTNLNLSYNNIQNSPSTNPTLTLENCGKTLEWLTLNNNTGLQCLDVQYLTVLKYLTLNDCPDLASIFICLPENSQTTLANINLSNCSLTNFYPVSLPSLRTLILSNNRLMTSGTDNPFVLGDYPELTTLSLSNNKNVGTLDVTKCTKLEELFINGCNFEIIDVSQAPALRTLNVADNNIRSLDLGNNTVISTLNISGNPITTLDVSKLPSIASLNISNTQISRVDLMEAYFLKSFNASNTLLEFVDFNGLQANRMERIDLRNCPNFTPESMNYTLRTVPVAKSSYSEQPNLLIAGSNGEHADTSYPTSSDFQWICDVQGDGTAKNTAVNVTIADATDTGENKTGKLDHLYSHFGMGLDYDLDVMQTEGGKFILCQWQPLYFQTIKSVNETALKGVPMYVYSYPDEGKRFKSVTVNGKEIFSPWFIVSEPSTIKVNYTSEMASVSFDVKQGQVMSLLVNTVKSGSSVWIDWGTGARTEYPNQNAYISGSDRLSGSRIDGTAAGTRVTVYGDLSGVDVSGFGEYGEAMGLWDNHIQAMDLSNAPDLKYFNGYWNPIKTIDLSQNTALEVLNLSYTALKSIDLSNNPNIIMLEAYSDTFGDEEDGIALLDAINVTNMPYLQYLDVKGNNISSLDVTNNKYLKWLYAQNNKITSIDLSNNTELVDLSLSGNKLSSIDLSNNTALTELAVGSNLLTGIDLTHNLELVDLNVSCNDIHALDLGKNTKLQFIYINGNGMTAPELNEFYYALPQRINKSDDDDEPALGYNLAIIQGGDKKQNEGTRADSSIAIDRGWIPSHQGTNGGCEWAYLDIIKPIHGTIKVVDAQGNEYTHGSKVTKYLPLTIIATPDDGYSFSTYSLNNEEAVKSDKFEMPGIYTKLNVSFAKGGGVNDAAADDMTITAVEGGIRVCASYAVATVYTTNGVIAAGDVTVEGDRMIQLTPGCYIVRLNSGKTVRTAKVIVK